MCFISFYGGIFRGVHAAPSCLHFPLVYLDFTEHSGKCCADNEKFKNTARLLKENAILRHFTFLCDFMVLLATVAGISGCVASKVLQLRNFCLELGYEESDEEY